MERVRVCVRGTEVSLIARHGKERADRHSDCSPYGRRDLSECVIVVTRASSSISNVSASEGNTSGQARFFEGFRTAFADTFEQTCRYAATTSIKQGKGSSERKMKNLLPISFEELDLMKML